MLQLILLIMAFLCFLLGATGMPFRVNLVALGLCFWVLTLIIGK